MDKKTYWLPAANRLSLCQSHSIICDQVELSAIKVLAEKGYLRSVFNYNFFISSDSREPEVTGMAGSIMGSLFTVIICMVLAFPLALLSAIYLQEFAPKNKLTYLIEININNLAAVPSIVFGILGLAVFLITFGIPRSSSLAGGLTLAVMALPTMIVTTRQALATIPLTIKHGAMALGASDLQILLHHTIPLAMPGIMTGAILTICRILGETAPMIMIGMVAFIADIPTNFLDPATVMPVQIYLWADSPETAFKAKTAAAILVLLVILFFMNILAIIVRKKYEIKW